MEIARNQRNFLSLNCVDQSQFEKIYNNNKTIIIFGSNGQGKSTIKRMIMSEYLEKNFDFPYMEQSNLLFDKFSRDEKIVYDEDFIKNVVYENDGVSSNHLKIILKTDEINDLLKNKNLTNQHIINLKNTLKSLIDKLTLVIQNSKYSYLKPTATQILFSKPVLDVKSSSEIKDFLSNKDLGWWIQGYEKYVQNEKCHCPWCDTNSNDFDSKVKTILNDTISISQKASTAIKQSTEKKQFLSELNKQEYIGKKSKEIVESMLSQLNESQISDCSKTLQDKMKELLSNVEHDLNLINNIYVQIKEINNLLDMKKIIIESNLKDLKFLKKTSEIMNLEKDLDELQKNINDAVDSIKNSNEKLIKTLENSKIEINAILDKLGMNFEFDILENNIISTEVIDEKTNYVIIKSKSGIDLTQTLGNVLSYGEHSTLAFAIFVANIKQLDNDKMQKTIIIYDDPISSYDLYRRYISISMINELGENAKKTIIFTHENSFVISLVNGIKKKKYLFNLKTKDGKGVLEKLEPSSLFTSEIRYYKELLTLSSCVVFKINALRKLVEFIRYSEYKIETNNLYNYLCLIYHYRKNEEFMEIDSAKKEFLNVIGLYGLVYEDYDFLFDKDNIISEIDNYYKVVKDSGCSSLSLEDIICFRILAEKSVRDDSYVKGNLKAYDREFQDCWNFSDSSYAAKLQYYKPYLNSLCHLDDEESIQLVFTLSDYKFIPSYIKEAIYNIIFGNE